MLGRQRGAWLVLLALAVVLVPVASACSPLASKGTMPPPGPNGMDDLSAMPDFIAVAGRDGGIAGYVRKGDARGAVGDDPWIVYGDDLRTVVGHMVADVGFVPLGMDPAAMPTIEVSEAPAESLAVDGSGQAVLYVRNDGDAVAWVTVLVDAKPWNSTGYWGLNLGAGCYAMPRGSRLVLVDRDPEEAGSSVVRQLYVRGQEPDPPSLWILIGRDGTIEQGTGVPAWWGEPQSC